MCLYVGLLVSVITPGLYTQLVNGVPKVHTLPKHVRKFCGCSETFARLHIMRLWHMHVKLLYEVSKHVSYRDLQQWEI